MIAIAARMRVANEFITCADQAVRLNARFRRTLDDQRDRRRKREKWRLVIRGFLATVVGSKSALHRENAGEVSRECHSAPEGGLAGGGAVFIGEKPATQKQSKLARTGD